MKLKPKPLTKKSTTKKDKGYHIITIGCQMNIADSERLAAFLENQGFVFKEKVEQAGVIIINTCGVRQMAEDRVYGLVNTISKKNSRARIIITGCLSGREDVKKRLAGRVDWFLPASEMMQIPELLVGATFEPKFSLDEVRLKQGEKYLNISPKLSKGFSAYVPIGNGCNNFCSYCVVPYARGREVYRSAKEIISEVKALIKNGYREISLIAQNVNSYNDRGYDFPKLLETIAKLPGEFWLRFSSSHPKDMSDQLITVLGKYDKICPHLHLAVQSGDDEILKAMNRQYTAKHYENLISKVRQAKPQIAITTDVIVGFPGETKKQFLNTAKLFKKIKFDLAYIAQYSPRPGTASARLKDNVSQAEKKRREEVINEILKATALKNNKNYLGEVVTVLIEGINKRGKYYGKTAHYQTVLINSLEPATKKLIGTFASARIKEILPFALEGELVVRQSPVVVILGTTSAGKTSLAVKLAAKFQGEIISADSRQVYKGMDIGTGKDLAEYVVKGQKIKYHLIDVISPRKTFDLAKYQRLAFKAISDIISRGHLPIIVGGSGLYLQAVVDNYKLSQAKPDLKKREALEKLGAVKLLAMLEKLKPEFASRLNNSDRHNARRLARYLEIAASGEEKPLPRGDSLYNFLVLGLNLPDDILRLRINSRLATRLDKEGLVEEVKRLHQEGVSWSRLFDFGLEYRFVSDYLQAKMPYEEMVLKLQTALYRFAKRQKTWFKRWEKQGRTIKWVKDLEAAEKELVKWL